MTSKIKFTKQHPRDLDIQGMQREIEDKVVALDKDGNIILDRDIHCRSIYVEGDSLYLGGIKVEVPKHSNDAGYWEFDRLNKKMKFTVSAIPGIHATTHESGGSDETSHDDLVGFVANEHLPGIDEDDMASDSATRVPTEQSVKAYVDAKDINIRQHFDVYDPSPARSSESNIHGGLLALATGDLLNSDPTDLVVTKGIGKLLIVINAGSDLVGEITVTGTSVDRSTGETTADDTDTITVDALTTDTSDTDSNGNTRHAFSGAYITSKWFTGTVTLSTTNLTLTDVDVYHVSFEQFGDQPGVELDQLDANIFTTNVSAEFDAYVYALMVSGDKCTITREASVNVGADGETAIANKYWRLKRKSIGKDIDGTTDGFWLDVHYSNSPAYVEDVTIRVWYVITITLNA